MSPAVQKEACQFLHEPADLMCHAPHLTPINPPLDIVTQLCFHQAGPGEAGA